MNSFIEERSENGYYISSWRHNNPLPECLKSISGSEFETLLSLYITLGEIKQKDNIDTFKKDIEHKFFEKTKVFEEEKSLKDRKIKELQESYNILYTNFSALQDSQQKNIDKEHKFFLTQIECIRTLGLSKDQQINDLKQELQQYKNQSLIQQNSSKKGKQGEQKFFNLVNQYTCWALEDTSGTPDAGDFQGLARECKVFIDTKTYNLRGVPKCEIDKFKRNIDSNKDIPIGMLISMESKIVGAPQDFLYCEINSNNQLLLYIQNFLSYDMETIFSILNNYIDIAKFIYNRSEKSEQIDIQPVKPILTSLSRNITQTINKITNMKKSWIQKIDTDCSNLKNDVTQTFDMVKTILNTLFPEESISNMLIEDSEGEKKKPTKRKKKSITPVVPENE
uniref:Uncharacterized protein n=1 Tax=viral metagenome TaxID=1070528 RepID=A0A6C0IGE9_9ZZZZ